MMMFLLYYQSRKTCQLKLQPSRAWSPFIITFLSEKTMDKKLDLTCKPGTRGIPNRSSHLNSITEKASPCPLDVSLAYPQHDSLIYKWSTSYEEALSCPELGLPMYEEPPPHYNVALDNNRSLELGSSKDESFVAMRHQNHQQLQQQTSINMSATMPLRQTSVIVQTAPLIVSYRSNIALACFTFWLCGFIFGSVAFCLAGRWLCWAAFCIYISVHYVGLHCETSQPGSVKCR